MNVQQRQLYYGGLIGAVSFLSGLVITYITVPGLKELPQATPAKATAWVWLAAHFIEITGDTSIYIFDQPPQVNPDTFPQLRTLRALPVVLVAFGAVLTSDAVAYTTRPRYVLYNAGAVLYGYLGAGLLTFLLADAQPGVSIIVWVLLIGGGALAVGSRAIGTATGGMPFLGFASLWTVLLVGFLVIIGGLSLIDALAPLAGVGVAGVLIGVVLHLGVRELS